MAARKKKAAKRAARRPARKPKRAVSRRTRRHQPESLRLRECLVGFTVNDIDKSRAFYRDVLGFTEGESFLVAGKLMGIELKAGTISLWLNQDDWAKGRDRTKGIGIRTYLTTVQDIDALAARIKERGWKLDHEPQTQPWGVRDIGVTDPDGFRLTIQAKFR